MDRSATPLDALSTTLHAYIHKCMHACSSRAHVATRCAPTQSCPDPTTLPSASGYDTHLRLYTTPSSSYLLTSSDAWFAGRGCGGLPQRAAWPRGARDVSRVQQRVHRQQRGGPLGPHLGPRDRLVHAHAGHVYGLSAMRLRHCIVLTRHDARHCSPWQCTQATFC